MADLWGHWFEIAALCMVVWVGFVLIMASSSDAWIAAFRKDEGVQSGFVIIVSVLVFGSMPLVEAIKYLQPKVQVHHDAHAEEHGDAHHEEHSKREYKWGRKANVNDLIAKIEHDKIKKKKSVFSSNDKRSWWEKVDIRTNPEGPMRRSWDLLIVVLVLMLLVMIPLETFVDWWSAYYDIQIGDENECPDDDASYGSSYYSSYYGSRRLAGGCETKPYHKSYYLLSYTMDIIFWVDVWFNFTSSFSHGTHVIHDKKEIFGHYMWGNPLTDNTGWFKVDLIGGIPFELIGEGLVDKKDRKSIKILKWLKLPKLLRAGRLQKLMGKYVSFAMFLQHMALAVVFLHVFACVFMGHYGYESMGVDEDGHDIIYTKDVNGNSYYADKVCNIRNLYTFVDDYVGVKADDATGYSSSSSYSSYGDDASSYSSYSRRLATDDAPNFHDFSRPNPNFWDTSDNDCISTWDAYVEAICSIMSMIVGGTSTVLGVPDHMMGTYNMPRGSCYPRVPYKGDARESSYYSSYGDDGDDASSYSSYSSSSSYYGRRLFGAAFGAAAAAAGRNLGGSYYGTTYYTDEHDYTHGAHNAHPGCEEAGVTGSGLRILCIPIGTLIYWLLQADIVVVMFNSTNAYSRQRAGVTKAQAEVEFFGFDDDLADKVNGALQYRWNGHIPSECSLIQDKALGAAIQKEIVLNFHGSKIYDEVLFSGCNSQCIAAAAFALRTNIVANYTYVYRKGELGLECYLLAKGDALALDDNNNVKTELPVGDMFGEMAVITHKETHFREEDVFALTYCELETLTLESFDKICGEYPVLEANAKLLLEIMRQDHDNHREQWGRFHDELSASFNKIKEETHQNVIKIPKAGGHGGHGDEHGEEHGHGDEHGEGHGHDEGMPYIPDWVFVHKDYLEARAALEKGVMDGTWIKAGVPSHKGGVPPEESAHGYGGGAAKAASPPPSSLPPVAGATPQEPN